MKSPLSLQKTVNVPINDNMVYLAEFVIGSGKFAAILGSNDPAVTGKMHKDLSCRFFRLFEFNDLYRGLMEEYGWAEEYEYFAVSLNTTREVVDKLENLVETWSANNPSKSLRDLLEELKKEL